MNRTRHQWAVQLQRDDGQMVEHRIANYWDPENDNVALFIGETAKAEAHLASGKRHEFHPVKVERVAA